MNCIKFSKEAVSFLNSDFGQNHYTDFHLAITLNDGKPLDFLTTQAGVVYSKVKSITKDKYTKNEQLLITAKAINYMFSNRHGSFMIPKETGKYSAIAKEIEKQLVYENIDYFVGSKGGVSNIIMAELKRDFGLDKVKNSDLFNQVMKAFNNEALAYYVFHYVHSNRFKNERGDWTKLPKGHVLLNEDGTPKLLYNVSFASIYRDKVTFVPFENVAHGRYDKSKINFTIYNNSVYLVDDKHGMIYGYDNNKPLLLSVTTKNKRGILEPNKNYTVAQIVNLLIDNGLTTRKRRLLHVLSQYNRSVRTVLTYRNNSTSGSIGNKNEIKLYVGNHANDTANTLIHELVHGMFANLAYSTIITKTNTDNMIKEIKVALLNLLKARRYEITESERPYGYTDDMEFLAEVVSNLPVILEDDKSLKDSPEFSQFIAVVGKYSYPNGNNIANIINYYLRGAMQAVDEDIEDFREDMLVAYTLGILAADVNISHSYYDNQFGLARNTSVLLSENRNKEEVKEIVSKTRYTTQDEPVVTPSFMQPISNTDTIMYVDEKLNNKFHKNILIKAINEHAGLWNLLRNDNKLVDKRGFPIMFYYHTNTGRIDNIKSEDGVPMFIRIPNNARVKKDDSITTYTFAEELNQAGIDKLATSLSKQSALTYEEVYREILTLLQDKDMKALTDFANNLSPNSSYNRYQLSAMIHYNDGEVAIKEAKDGTLEVLMSNDEYINIDLQINGFGKAIIRHDTIDRLANRMGNAETKFGSVLDAYSDRIIMYEDESFTLRTTRNDIPFIDLSDTKMDVVSYGNTVAKKLMQIFRSFGLHTQVAYNDRMKEAARVDYNPATKIFTITVNRFKMQYDSVGHEFGHILVELIDDEAFIRQGIDQLRGTKLWNEVARKYSTYDEYTLGKEVLTTAIGIFYNKELHTEFPYVATRGFKFWINRLIDRLSDLFKIKNSVAEQIANSMVTGEFAFSLKQRFEFDTQYQVLEDEMFEFVSTYNKFISDTHDNLLLLDKKHLNKDKHSVITTSLETLLPKLNKDTNVLSDIEDIKSFLVVTTGLTEVRDFFLFSMSYVRNNLDELANKYLHKKIPIGSVYPEDITKFGNTLFQAKSLLDMYLTVDDVVLIDKSELEDKKDEYVELIGIDGYNKLLGILESLKALHNELPLLNQLRLKLSNLYDVYNAHILSLSSNPEYEEEDMYEIVLTRLRDENTLGLGFMATYDSVNSLVSNLTKYLRYYSHRKRDLTRETVREFNTMYKKHVVGYKVRDLFDNLGRLAVQYNWNLVKEDKIKMYSEIKRELKAKYKGRGRTDFRTELYIRVAKELSKESEAFDNLDAIIRQKQKELSREEYAKWFKDNVYIDNTTMHPRLGSELVPLKDKYLNPQWVHIQQNEQMRIMHEYLGNLLFDLTKHLRYAPQQFGYLPAIAAKYKANKGTQEKDIITTDINGEPSFNLSMKYIGFIAGKQTLWIPQQRYGETEEEYHRRVVDMYKKEGHKFNTFAEILLYNQKVKEINKLMHGEMVDYNIKKAMPLFIESAIEHRFASEIEGSVIASMYALDNAKLNRTTITGKIQTDKYKTTPDRQPKRAVIQGRDSKASKHYKLMIEMVFYDHFLKESVLNRPLQIARDYIATLGLGLNVFAMGKNINFGMAMIRTEATASKFFGIKEFRAAQGLYMVNTPTIAYDSIRDNSTNLISGLLKYFDAIEDYTTIIEKSKPNRYANKVRRVANNIIFSTTTFAEHAMHNIPLLAMLQSHRLMDGKLYTFRDFELRSIEPYNKDNFDSLSEYKNYRKERLIELKAEFDAAPRLIDIFELDEDGYVKLKEGYEVDDLELDSFRDRVEGVNHKLHGIYDKEDKGTIEHWIMGVLLMQFRHWLVPGWNKRFGARGIPFVVDRVWNERRGEYDVGDYNIATNLVVDGFRIGYKESLENNDGMVTPIMYAKAVVDGMWQYFRNIQVAWFTMTTDERAAVIRTLREGFEMVMIMAMIIFGVKLLPDDEDKRKKKGNKAYELDPEVIARHFLLYQLDAYRTELMAYTPLYGWMNESFKILGNPTATWSYASQLIKVTQATMLYMAGSDKAIYQRGMNKGRVKAVVHAERMVFPLNQWYRIRSLMTQKRAYKSFQTMINVNDPKAKKKTKTKHGKKSKYTFY